MVLVGEEDTLIDLVVIHEIGHFLLSLRSCDCSGQGGLSVVHMAYGAHVEIWFLGGGGGITQTTEQAYSWTGPGIGDTQKCTKKHFYSL